VGTGLSTLLKGRSASATSNQGTWTYSAPKVVFESQNVLAQLGSSVASSKIESTLKSQLTKMGFKAGKTTITLNEDKTCVFSLNGKTANGTYTYDPNTSLLTITGALGVTSTTCHCTLNGSELYMLFDADKLLNVATSLGSKSTSTLGSLLQSYTGLKLGWAMTK
jgi:Zn/Cd-binding protein ZinT